MLSVHCNNTPPQQQQQQQQLAMALSSQILADLPISDERFMIDCTYDCDRARCDRASLTCLAWLAQGASRCRSCSCYNPTLPARQRRHPLHRQRQLPRQRGLLQAPQLPLPTCTARCARNDSPTRRHYVHTRPPRSIKAYSEPQAPAAMPSLQRLNKSPSYRRCNIKLASMPWSS